MTEILIIYKVGDGQQVFLNLDYVASLKTKHREG